MSDLSSQLEEDVSSPADEPRFAWLRDALWRTALGGAAVFSVGGTFGGLAIARPDLVLVQHVVFVGNKRATAAELRHLVDIRNGTTMWGVDLAHAVDGAEEHPWVRRAWAWRRWPSTVVVQVDEFVPVALLDQGDTTNRDHPSGDGLCYVDAEGRTFLQARERDLDYPVITGLDPALGKAHPDLPGLVLHDALSLLTELEQRKLALRSQVSEINFSATHGFTVHLLSGARVVFDLKNQRSELDRLGLLVQQGVDLHKPLFVDLAPESLAIVRPVSPT